MNRHHHELLALLAMICAATGGLVEDAIQPGVQWGVVKGIFNDPGNLNVPPVQEPATCILGDTLYLHGGEDLLSGDKRGTFYQLNMQTLRWAVVTVNSTSAPNKRAGHFLLCDEARSLVYLIGGEEDISWKFDTITLTWSRIASKGTDPLAPGDDEISNEFVPIDTTDFIVVAGNAVRLSTNWYLYNKNTDSWEVRVEPMLSIEDPGGAGIGNKAFVIGGTVTYGEVAQPNTLSFDTSQPDSTWQLVNTDLAGEEHYATYLGNDIILLMGDVGGKGELAPNNGIALLNVSSPERWSRVNRTNLPGEWIPGVSKMAVLTYKGLLVVVGGTMDNNGTYVNEDLYVFSLQECPLNCSGRGQCVLGNCLCSESSGVSCETPDPTSKDLLPLILGPVGGVVLFVLIASAVMWRTTAQTRMLKKMYNTTRIAGDLAEQVARMELDELDYLLDIEQPTAVQASFVKIVRILKTYKPYIPEALFMGLLQSDSREFAGNTQMVQAPGQGNGTAAIVFTDIKSSTATWEACPDGMKKGLQVHNEAIRRCLVQYGGYEVKTIGDSFMVAFERPVDALRFALSVQEELHASTWPAALLALPWCSKEDGMNGLRVRIGVQCGEVDVQVNDLTGRRDYFGTTVNKAARLESTCLAGGVATTQDVLDLLAQDDASISPRSPSSPISSNLRYRYTSTMPSPLSQMLGCLKNPAVLSMGERALHGIAEKAEVMLLVPQSLAQRTEGMLVDLQTGAAAKSISGGSSVSITVMRAQKEVTRGGDLLVARDSVTVGQVDIVFGEDLEKYTEPQVPVGEAMGTLFTQMERTQGTVVSVVGSSVYLAWNTTRKCTAHVENSLQFVLFAQRQSISFAVSSSGVKGLQVGLCTGHALMGHVGTSSKRFVNVMGKCVDTAGRLSRATLEHRVQGLYTDLLGTAKKYSSCQLNKIDEFDYPNSPPVPVYEVCPPDEEQSLLMSPNVR
eukprot:TRINITY_DN298_c1_g1_i1.p1 TRINITY_DN298_c1_g1~~TRINITY_DN298_c1_g1_i1.p1  ORF type:complete len:961 (+),score=266.83 TRINITY_DN298_c1_g1_i1:53-2935(+)